MRSEAELAAEQNTLRQKISLCDSFDVAALRTAAGVDLAYETVDGALTFNGRGTSLFAIGDSG